MGPRVLWFVGCVVFATIVMVIGTQQALQEARASFSEANETLRMTILVAIMPAMLWLASVNFRTDNDD